MSTIVQDLLRSILPSLLIRHQRCCLKVYIWPCEEHSERPLADSEGLGPSFRSRCISLEEKSKEKRLLVLREVGNLYPEWCASVHLINQLRTIDNDRKGKEFILNGMGNMPSVEGAPDMNDDAHRFLSEYLIGDMMKMTKTMVFQDYADTWLTTYLDEETLAEDPLRLLGLLHARTAYKSRGLGDVRQVEPYHGGALICSNSRIQSTVCRHARI